MWQLFSPRQHLSRYPITEVLVSVLDDLAHTAIRAIAGACCAVVSCAPGDFLFTGGEACEVGACRPFGPGLHNLYFDKQMGRITKITKIDKISLESQD